MFTSRWALCLILLLTSPVARGADDIFGHVPFSLSMSAGQSFRRNAGNTAFEAYTPGTGGGTPGGSNTQVQFNDSGLFGGDAAFTFDKSVPQLALKSGGSDDSIVVKDQAGVVRIGLYGDNSPQAAIGLNGGGLASVTLSASTSNAALVSIQDGTGSISLFGNGTYNISPTNTPSTPMTDFLTIYQSTSKNIAAKNDAGTVNHGVQTKAVVGGQFLTGIADDGSVSTASAGGGGTPGGSDTQVQYNDGGAFGGDSAFTWDKTNHVLSLIGDTMLAGDFFPLVLGRNVTTGSGIAGNGTGISLYAEDSTTNNVFIGSIAWEWLNATHGSNTSRIYFNVSNGGSSAGAATLSYGGLFDVAPGGGFSIAASAPTGRFLQGDNTKFVISSFTLPTSPSTSGKMMQSNGSNIVMSTPTFPATAGTSGNVLTSDGTNWLSSAPAGGGGGTVTSVGLVGTSNQITITGTSPITTSGSWTVSIPTAAQLNVAKLTNLTTNGFVKTGSSDGTLSIDTNTYLTSTSISDTAFASSWDSVTTIAPSKNAVYDELHKIDSADDGTIVNAGTGFRIAGVAGSNKILKGNGTNFVASTETYAAPGTSGNVLTSDGTNWLSSAPSGGAAPENLTISDAATNTIVEPLFLGHNSSSAGAAGLGSRLVFRSKDSTTADAISGKIDVAWTTATHGSNISNMVFSAVSGGATGNYTNPMTLQGNGILDVTTGYSVAGAAASGKILRGDGTKFVASTPTWPNAASTSGKVVQSDGTNMVMSTPTFANPGTAGNTYTSDGTNWLATPPDGSKPNSTASTTTWTPDFDTYSTEVQTALAGALTINAPTWTGTRNGVHRTIRLKDNGTARAITWTTGSTGAFRASTDLALPTTTTANKTIYCRFYWNNDDSRWDFMAKLDNF